jgi:hypothetical protein
MVLPDSRWVPRALRYSRTITSVSFFRLRGCHPLWPPFPECSARSTHLVGYLRFPTTVSQHRCSNALMLTLHRFRLLPVRSPLLGESRLISFPSATEMFQFTEFPTLAGQQVIPARLPYSEISESRPVSDSSELFAAVHVLRRLSMPRHSPRALSSLTYP